MLRKNIYLIYPPGYSGSYISWLLHKSEISTASSTVDNPLNLSKNDTYGGQGTSHLHHRIPTHASIKMLAYWLILNQPKDKRIYLVNAWDQGKFGDTLNAIVQMDRDPVIIHITADNEDVRALGNINAITKWFLYFKVRQLDTFFNFNDDPEDITSRNRFVELYDIIFPTSYTIDFDKNVDTSNLAQLDKKNSWYNSRDTYKLWYELRHKYNPHEVNESMYVIPKHKPDNYFSIDLLSIYGDNFTEILSNIINQLDIGTFDFTYASGFHQNYVDAQIHLQYITEIEKFRETKVLTEYLQSHSLIQALVIREIKHLIPDNFNWQSKTLQEIVKAIQ